jgi:DNA-binding transcriptional MerR regulator
MSIRAASGASSIARCPVRASIVISSIVILLHTAWRPLRRSRGEDTLSSNWKVKGAGAMKGPLYKIGELANLSGVSSKTIRFYSDIGALPPTRTTEAGYRLYDDADRGRLATIRALREIGLDLPTIIDLLGDKVPVAETLAVQLEAIELTLRTARRQRAVLKAAIDRGEAAALAYLDRAGAIAKFGAIERQEFLAARMERVFAGVEADEEWKAQFWRGAVLDLPEELSEAQFTAWLELAELLSDESFLRRLNAIGRESWNRPRHSAEQKRALGEMNAFYAEVAEALRAGHTPGDERGRQLLDTYLRMQAQALRREAHDPALPAAVLAMIERNTEPRAARYWELIGIIKGWPASPIAEAHDWLVQGLCERADKEGGGGVGGVGS